LKNLLNIIKENRALFSFLGWAFLLLVIWVVAETFFHHQIMSIHYMLIHFQTKISVWLLDIFGFVAAGNYKIPGYMSSITIDHGATVYVGSGCSGLELFLIFSSFIIIFKGELKNKVWFLPAGLLIILVLNIIRICVLALLLNYAPDHMDFNHKYTFVIIVYGAIFGLWWWWWVNKYSAIKS